MGTRSNTLIIETGRGGEHKLLNMYRQYDGYPQGHGEELFLFLKGMHVVNGMSSGQPERIANGMGCLAAQMVAHFKKEPGGIYIEDVDSECDDDYCYEVRGDTFNGGDGLEITVKSWGDSVIFKGNIEEFGAFCSGADEE